MSDVHVGQAHAHHALLTTVVALTVALLVGAGAVVLYYEVIDSDIVLDTPAPAVQVITPEQVSSAQAMKDEAQIAAGMSAVVAMPAAGTHPGDFLSPDARDNNAAAVAGKQIKQQRIAEQFRNFPH